MATPLLLLAPPKSEALLVMAHGAGAGMRHPFMEDMVKLLAERRIATARFEFPYMAAKAKRPDPPRILTETVRAAVAEARATRPTLPLFAGGKSLGGRMTSTAQAEDPLDGVVGLVFFGFPLHTAKKPSIARAKHLGLVEVPMLFLQGTRDALCDLTQFQDVQKTLGDTAQTVIIDGADHSFGVLKSSGRTAEQVLAQLADETARFIKEKM